MFMYQRWYPYIRIAHAEGLHTSYVPATLGTVDRPSRDAQRAAGGGKQADRARGDDQPYTDLDDLLLSSTPTS